MSPDVVVERALQHPMRLRVLAVIAEAGRSNPSEIADTLEADLGVVAYHVRTLQGAGLVKQTKTDFVRGAVRHHYRIAAKARHEESLDVLAELEGAARRAREALGEVTA